MCRSLNKSGFTLIEVIVVIAIIGIMGAIAVPSFLSWLPNLHFRDATQNLQLDMNYAKMTATKRHTKVHIRFVDTGNCPTSTAAFPNATSSYTVASENKDGSEDILRSITFPDDVTLCVCPEVTNSNDIAILSNGLPETVATEGTCIVNSKLRKSTVEINLTGNVTIIPQ